MAKTYKTGIGLGLPVSYHETLNNLSFGLGLSYRGKARIGELIDRALTQATPEMMGTWLAAGLKAEAEEGETVRTTLQISIPNYEKTEAWGKHLGISQAVLLRLTATAVVLGVWKHEQQSTD